MPLGDKKSALKRFGAKTILVWTLLIGTLLGIRINDHNHELIKEATNEARDYFRLNLFYRAWASKMGGVYVPADKVTPNPYLQVPNRDITTSDNRQLTLVNPAYMTRMVFEEILAASPDPIRNKITSLKPLNPVNAPDEWEKQSLMAFERKEYTERSEVTEMLGQPYLRFISAFTTSEACLKCHAHQGYKVGDVRGAIVISVPLAKRLQLNSLTNWKITGTYGFLWLIGSIGIAFASNKRQHDEEALWQEHARAQTYLETVETMIVTLDSDGIITVINHKACQILGYNQDELIGRSWFTTCLPQPEGMETIYPHFKKVLAGEFGAAEYHENMVVTKSGELRLIAWHNSLLRNNQGEIVGTISAGDDITERKQMEEIQSFLAQNSGASAGEPFFDALARFLGQKLDMDFVCIDRLEGDGLTASTVSVWHDGRFEDNVCYALKDTPCGDVVGKDVCCFPSGVCKLFPDDKVLQDLRAESYFGITLWDYTGQPVGLIALIGRKPLVDRGIAETALKMVAARAAGEIQHMSAEELLRKNERRIADALDFNNNILKTSSIGIVTYRSDGQCIFANEAAAIVAGTEAERLLAQNFNTIPSWRISGMYDTALKVLKTNEACNMEVHVVTTFGKDVWLDLELSSFTSNDEQHLLVFIQDISERKCGEAERLRLESQLRQAQKMESVGRLAGGVAHDFNNMLSVIMGHAELGLMHLDPTHPVCADLKEIGKTAERAADLTRQLLTFARKQTVMPRIIDLNDTVTNMLKMLQRLIGEDIHLTWQPSPELCQVKMDPSQLDQILANLCVNARDAIKDTGRITIETATCSIDADYCTANPEATPGDYVRLVVCDSGSGMDKETQTHIFEPFYTTKEMGKGTGLGLATVYGAVKQNTGFINIYSEPGQGTTFSIYLPRETSTGTARRATTAAETAVPRGQETILLVEDEPSILNIASLMLEKQGYSVLKANNPGEALRLAREHVGQIDLLMTDVIMPEMNGRDLAKNIQSLYPNIKRLFMSGYTADVIAHHGVLDAGVHFIQKPFSLPNMAATVRDVLDKS